MISRSLAASAAALLLLTASAAADADDPPARVGRLSFIEGTVNQRAPGKEDWAPATLNYPVTTGFAVATDPAARTELEVRSMALRVGSESEVDVNALEDTQTSITVARGEINLRLGTLEAGDHVEVATPRGTVEIVEPGQCHIDGGTTESPTRLAVLNGKARILRDSTSFDVDSGHAALLTGIDTTKVSLTTAAPDPLDDWALARDKRERDEARSAASTRPTVSPEMTGAQDLDAYGRWETVPEYGTVWRPEAVPVGWAPYRYGHWAWVPPWGWTWIDDAPWGFAPFHYGRWVWTAEGWFWAPGVLVEQPVFAPALVAFIGVPRHGFFDRDDFFFDGFHHVAFFLNDPKTRLHGDGECSADSRIQTIWWDSGAEKRKKPLEDSSVPPLPISLTAWNCDTPPLGTTLLPASS
jgi:hypothetical protein